MPRELRISATVPLPDGDFEEAQAIVEAKPLLDALKRDWGNMGDVSFEIVTPRPRKAGDAETPA